MNTSHLISLLLAVAVVLLSVKVIFLSNDTKPAASVQSAAVDSLSIILDNIHTRTSIRAYTSEKITDAEVETMLRAAMAAPTAGNRQPWRYIVIDDRATLDAFVDVARGMNMASKAPLAILVCGEPSASFPANALEYSTLDASAATENLLLAAHAMGLGAVWCSVYPVPERMTAVTEMMKLPDGIVPLNLIFVGHPAEDPAPKDKWKPEYIHRNQW